MPDAAEVNNEALLFCMEQSISMSAVFDLLYSVEMWIADTGASNHTNPYKKGCIKMRADKGCTGMIKISGKSVQNEYTMDILGTFYNKYANLGMMTTHKGSLTRKITTFSYAG